MGRFLQMHANKRQELDQVYAGDIVAAVGLKQVVTGHTLSAVNAPIVLESLDFPEPVIAIAIEPKTTADMDKLVQSLDRLAIEDPSFKVSTDTETGQLLISGMGELHLEIIVDRLLREFGVDANVGRPQVAYKETISVPASGMCRVREADGQRERVRGREARGRARRNRLGLRVRERGETGSDSRASTSSRSSRDAARRSRAAISAATRSST